MTPEMHRIVLKSPKKALAHPFGAQKRELPHSAVRQLPVWVHCVLPARQQHRQHGFLDVQTVLCFVKDLVRVLLEQGG